MERFGFTGGFISGADVRGVFGGYFKLKVEYFRGGVEAGA